MREKAAKPQTPKRRIIDPVVRAYGIGEVARLTGVSRITLHVWDRSGFLAPTMTRGGNGTGNRRKYSFADVVAVRMARALREEGISLQALRKVSKYLREREGVDNPFAERYLAVQGDDVVMVRKDEVVSVLNKPGQYTMVLHLDPEAEARRIISKLKAEAA